MRAWRIARERYALDRSGAGGLADGGRWHARGMPVIYAGLSVEICAMEKLAHTGHILPPDLMLVALSLPDDMALYETADSAALPGWEATPPGAASLECGTTFLRSSAGARFDCAFGHRARGTQYRAESTSSKICRDWL